MHLGVHPKKTTVLLTRNDAIEACVSRAAPKHDIGDTDKDKAEDDEQHPDPHVASDATAQEGNREEGSEDDHGS